MVELDRAIVGSSRALRQVMDDADAVAATDSKILITGESGVGKEVVVRRIHRRSRRANAPLVTINCAGVPESLLESELFGHVRGSFTGADRDRAGFLEMAHCGTILLDEVGEMSLRMQRTLLRFLENGEIQRVGSDKPQTIVDVRVLAATNRDLLEEVRKKEFREDLYYRLNIVHLVVPPLRQRREDIKLLWEHFMAEMSRHHRFPVCHLTPEAVTAIDEYDWPGNVRELRNVVERLILTRGGTVVTPSELGLSVRRSGAVGVATSAELAKTPDGVAETCYRRLISGRESFWDVVYEPFMLRDLTRETLRGIISRGLEQTKGNYRLVAELFNLPSSDYKRFLSFLQKHDCQMPFQKFRMAAIPPPPMEDRRVRSSSGAIATA
jgi:transcriptional regulator with GAF, ATPase, and Fis domain